MLYFCTGMTARVGNGAHRLLIDRSQTVFLAPCLARDSLDAPRN